MKFEYKGYELNIEQLYNSPKDWKTTTDSFSNSVSQYTYNGQWYGITLDQLVSRFKYDVDYEIRVSKTDMTNKTKVLVYKRSIQDNYIVVGEVDSYGDIIFNTTLKTYDSTKLPNCYYSEFYIDEKITTDVYATPYDNEEKEITHKRQKSTIVTGIRKREFNRKNYIQQIQTFKNSCLLEKRSLGISQYCVTGYIDKDGVAVYYDQYKGEQN